MLTDQRGVIRNREWATQIRDFSGLRYGNITPTDIDGFIEYKNIAFIIIETKHEGGEMPFGQRLALQRLCDTCQYAGKETLLIVASHNTTGDIDFANTRVVETRYLGRWKEQSNQMTTKEAVDLFLNFVINKKNVEDA